MDQVGCARASSTLTDSRSASGMVSERPARGGEDERVDRLRGAAFEALEDRGVLAVDRKQEPSAPLPGGDREVACGDEALLVRERERDAALERPQRGADSGEADDRVQDEVGLRRVEELGQVAADLHVLDVVARGERVERLRARAERDDLEVRMGIDDLERLPPDRAGGPEQRDPLEVGGHAAKANRPCVQKALRSRHRALAAPLRGRPEPARRAVPSRRRRAARGGRRHPRRLLEGALRPLVDDADSARTSPPVGSPRGISSTDASGTAAGGRRPSRTSRPASTCWPSSTPRSISSGSARSGTAPEATSRSGRLRGRRSPATHPAPRRASSRVRSCPRPASPIFVSPPSRRRRTSRRVRCSVARPTSSRALRARVAARAPAARRRAARAPRRARRDRVALEISRSYAAAAGGARRPCELRVLRARVTSSTSTPRRTRGRSAATGWSSKLS